MKKPTNITVVGLGYVGLPLGLAFADEFDVTGFDVEAERVEELMSGDDRNREVPKERILESKLKVTSDPGCITNADFIVVTVPTPVTADHQPDLSLLESASNLIGVQLRERSSSNSAPIIVYESTTYPGCTEDFCGPIIAQSSGLTPRQGYFLGYSPERTNFGDADHTLESVVKVVSGETLAVAEVVADTYGRIAKAGTHMAADIRTAEASKVIENIQRDLNIALFNELSMIFDRMGIRSSEVFSAAATKWNFHKYQPGLVGGHCIPVDPYYLTYAASNAGYDADMILAGRAVNESVPDFLVTKAKTLLSNKNIEAREASVLLLGATFKKDVVDIRNSKAIALGRVMNTEFGRVDVFDPLISSLKFEDAGIELVGDPFSSVEKYDLVVLAVAHSEFENIEGRVSALLAADGILMDVTGTLNLSETQLSPDCVWAL